MVLLDRNLPRSSYDAIVDSLAATYAFRVDTRWTTEPPGFVCSGLTAGNLSRLADDPRVELIEEDFTYTPQPVLSGTQSTWWPTGNYLWYLDRIDELTWNLRDGTYDMCPEGRQVYAYVVDVGVRADHEQFNMGEPFGRVVHSRTFDDGSANGYPDTTNACTTAGRTDFWHGTAVASMLAGTTIGGAKTQIISLRTAACGENEPRASWLVSAVRWIRSGSDPYRDQPAVVNLSAAVSPFQAASDFENLNAAVQALVTNTQIPFFTSANNWAGDACQFSPASLAYTNTNPNGFVFSVGGTSVAGCATSDPNDPCHTDPNDYRYQRWNDDGTRRLGQEQGSNGGRCVSAYAPAVGIYVAQSSAPNAYGVFDGTSFSSPLAAAVAARYMERTGVRDYRSVFNWLLTRGNPTIVNVDTPQFWMCFSPANRSYSVYLSNPGTCPPGGGLNQTTTPVYFPATNNESNARMLLSDMTCP